LIRSRDDPWK